MLYSYCRVVVFSCVVFFRIVLIFCSVLLLHFIEFFLVASISYFHPPPLTLTKTKSLANINKLIIVFLLVLLFFFDLSERRNLWNCEWNCERFAHNGLNHLCATDFRQMLALFKEGFRNFSASYKDMIQ